MSKLFDRLSEFLARRKGLLPIIGMILILINLVAHQGRCGESNED